MRITQRLFVEALTKLLMSDLEVNIHCPGTFINPALSEDESSKLCKVCQSAAEKYLGYGEEIAGNCPCGYINDFKPKDISTDDYEFFEDFIKFEATRIIEGWNNDHPSQVRLTNGGEICTK